MGGSFNPVHTGHMIVASAVSYHAGVDAVWLVLSPANPLKPRAGMESDVRRMEMLCIATEGASPRIGVCDVELSMPRPSYTIDTLRRLAKMYPDDRFRLVIGSDNWAIFDRWHHWQAIIDEFGVIVYPRPGYEVDEQLLPRGVEMVHAPMVEISSTMIRAAVARGESIRWYVPAGVDRYIAKNRMYGIKDT